MNVEAVGEQQRRALVDVVDDRLVQVFLREIGRQHRDQRGAFDGFGRFGDCQAVLLRIAQLAPLLRTPTTTSKPLSFRFSACARPWLP